MVNQPKNHAGVMARMKYAVAEDIHSIGSVQDFCDEAQAPSHTANMARKKR